MGKMLKSSVKALFKIRTKWLTVILPVSILGVFFFLVTVNNVFTETYDIERFSSANETIRSPITIENEQETKRKTRETVQSVKDRFDISAETTKEQVAYVEEIFDAIERVDAEESESSPDSPNENNVGVMTNQEKVRRLKQILSPNITEEVNDGILYELVEAQPQMRAEGKELLIVSLEEVLENGVRVENIQSGITKIEQDIKYSNLSNNIKEPLVKLSEFAVVENSFFDVEKTMDARKDAASSVEPVVIRAGEIIVREGQVITNQLYQDLKLAGLLDKERNIYPVIGLALLIFLIIFVIGYEMNLLSKVNSLDKGKISSIILISIIVVALMKVVSMITVPVTQLFFVVPVAIGSLLVKQLLNERFAIVLSILYAILGSIIFNGQIPGALNIEAGIYFFFSQMAGIIFLTNVKDRLAILKAGVGVTAINIITVLLFLFLSFEKYSIGELLIHSGFGIASAFLSAVLAIGLLPFFETGLGILSDIKLLSLASPNQPLLRKILTESPGTYHHSVMVANLSETACEVIGANGLLARVGAYYHDIGKTVRPHYFIENQLSISNPHDIIEPRQSAEIIINHPYDGAALLKKYKLPKEIINIAMQHHGTTLLKYFYYKEKENNRYVKENNFRYPGPKPQTKEAAIICICDSVEAAVRSLNEPTESKIEEIVSSIVNDRLMDGQLNECPLTLKELDKVHQTICESLKGIFHSRIQYPIKEAK
ncbi:HD family phosphohydrolase [Virgibacillus litoralis]|uniref:Nucleotidyltransferase with HDIG domain n=1 Tax=Virgibacillus litoralis TaxID=578221 RepID=A0ABS4H9I6_9BACI|nr:HDIG domain-containing metalloprotein [Virgibacillus litoralis]MBP1947573.1 putative nucleotidyltransferase with HDIG domain [Virgibacillus litoralis]